MKYVYYAIFGILFIFIFPFIFLGVVWEAISFSFSVGREFYHSLLESVRQGLK